MDPSQQQLEQIVAYLDGELTAVESAQVEQKLAADERFRQELQGAQRAWAALDQLPMAAVGNDFSRTTMEMVVSAARRDVEEKTVALPVQRRRRSTSVAVLATMALLLGVLLFRAGWQNPNRRLLADLPVIQHIDIYSQFRTVDFLQQLNRRLGEASIELAEPETLQTSLAEFERISAATNRVAWVASLPADEQITLRAKFNRFRDLSTQQQAQLRELHQQIEATDNRDQLLQTMFRYHQWLRSLPQSKQYEYRELSTHDRASRVAREMIEAESAQAFELTAQQLRDLFEQLGPYIQRVILKNARDNEQGIPRRSQRDRDRFSRYSQRKRTMFAFLSAMKNSPDQVRKFNALVIDSLPAEMRDPFQQLPVMEKRERIFDWVKQFHTQAIGGRRHEEVSEQELSDYFVELLEPAEKQRLLALPRDDMQQQLREMYRGRTRSHPRWGDGPAPRPFSPHRPGPPHPRGDHRDFRDEGWEPRQRPPALHRPPGGQRLGGDRRPPHQDVRGRPPNQPRPRRALGDVGASEVDTHHRTTNRD